MHATKVARYKEDLEKTTIDIEQTSSLIRITAHLAKSFKLFRSTHTAVHYELLIPDEAHLTAKTVSGEIEINNIGGGAEINGVSGDVRMNGADGAIRCKTVSGDVNMVDIHGKTDIKTTSGDIDVEHLKGSIEAESVSGDFDLEDFSDAEEIEVETISGDISMDGVFGPVGSHRLDSHSGTIRLSVEAEKGFELQADTFSGDMRCDFDLKVPGPSHIDSKTIRGIVGEGAVRLEITTFSGDIRIRKR
jgi:DUF4097 and DUF4098 domain-containing protein YvlB